MNTSSQLVKTPYGTIRESGPAGSLSDHATRFMIDIIDVPRGVRAVDAGCGTGVLGIFMAQAGAGHVIGTDIGTDILKAARYNAEVNGIRNIEFREGSLLEPIEDHVGLVVALLPHKPAPRPFNRRYYGGPEGTDLLVPLIRQAHKRLADRGLLYLYLNSIANPRSVLDVMREGFDTSLVAEKKRYFTKDEFDGLTEGMFKYLCDLRSCGISEFEEDSSGLYFTARIYRGQRL